MEKDNIGNGQGSGSVIIGDNGDNNNNGTATVTNKDKVDGGGRDSGSDISVGVISESIRRVIEKRFKISPNRERYLREWEEYKRREREELDKLIEGEGYKIREIYGENKKETPRGELGKITEEITGSILESSKGMPTEDMSKPKGWGGTEYPRCYNEHEEMRKRARNPIDSGSGKINFDDLMNKRLDTPIYTTGIRDFANSRLPTPYRWVRR